MSEEKIKILEMIQNGILTPAEGMELLDALHDSGIVELTQGISGGAKTSSNITDRFLRIRVNNASSKVNVNVPLSLLKVTSKFVTMGMGLIPDEARREMEKKGIDISKLDFEELVTLLDQGLIDGKLVDVETDDASGTTKVEVYVE